MIELRQKDGDISTSAAISNFNTGDTGDTDYAGRLSLNILRAVADEMINVPDMTTRQAAYGFMMQHYNRIETEQKRLKKDLSTILESLDEDKDNSMLVHLSSKIEEYCVRMSANAIKLIAITKMIREIRL